MKVDFLMTPGSEPRVFNLASRILSSNLRNNDKLDTSFNMHHVASYFKAMTHVSEYRQKIYDINENFGIVDRAWWSWVVILKATELFKEGILKTIKSDTVLFSSYCGASDLVIIDYLLREGLRVVAGGGITAISSGKLFGEEVKENLRCFYKTPEKLLKNLIFVKGYVDKNTDLHSVVKNWQNVELGPPTSKGMWDCDEDYATNYLFILDKLLEPHNIQMNRRSGVWEYAGCASMIFRLGCWWRKCAFCVHPKIKDLDILNDVDPEYVTEKIKYMTDAYGTNNIYIYDDYFIFNRKSEAVLASLKETNIKTCVYSGVTLMKNKKYAEKIAKYCAGVKIGLESTSDFTLDRITKGYKRADIIEAFKNIKRVFSDQKDAYIAVNLIMDLPVKNEEDLKDNYRFLNDLKQDMLDSGYKRFFYCPRYLQVLEPNRDKMIDGKYLVESETNPIGRLLVKEIIQKCGISGLDNRLWETSYTIPFKRYSETGKVIDSDINVVDRQTLMDLFGEWYEEPTHH